MKHPSHPLLLWLWRISGLERLTRTAWTDIEEYWGLVEAMHIVFELADDAWDRHDYPAHEVLARVHKSLYRRSLKVRQ